MAAHHKLLVSSVFDVVAEHAVKVEVDVSRSRRSLQQKALVRSFFFTQVFVCGGYRSQEPIKPSLCRRGVPTGVGTSKGYYMGNTYSVYRETSTSYRETCTSTGGRGDIASEEPRRPSQNTAEQFQGFLYGVESHRGPVCL